MKKIVPIVASLFTSHFAFADENTSEEHSRTFYEIGAGLSSTLHKDYSAGVDFIGEAISLPWHKELDVSCKLDIPLNSHAKDISGIGDIALHLYHEKAACNNLKNMDPHVECYLNIGVTGRVASQYGELFPFYGGHMDFDARFSSHSHFSLYAKFLFGTHNPSFVLGTVIKKKVNDQGFLGGYMEAMLGDEFITHPRPGTFLGHYAAGLQATHKNGLFIKTGVILQGDHHMENLELLLGAQIGKEFSF